MWEAPAGNGFDLAGALVPVEEIHAGGPPRDGIPALNAPRFLRPDQTRHLRPEDSVLGLALGGMARAYPIRVMNWHEVVNDHLGELGIVVTYCPLCGSGMAFRSDIGGRRLSFGVSGLLYNSDLLLYDRDTQSLWSQILGKAITGPMKGTLLTAVPLDHTTWADWRERHPQTWVLSEDTGHRRDYARDPYAGYEKLPDIYFPVRFRAQGYHPKERVLGLVLDGQAKAWPFVELAKAGGTITDTLAGQVLHIRHDARHGSARAYDANGRPLPGVTLYWFAWYAFHPETEVWRAPR
ncbi:MAG: DUF3179 domain-containing protein [Anaerolineae bacterium]